MIIACYLIGAVAGKVPWKFLVALHALINFNFCYLTQAPMFTIHSLNQAASTLQEFHQNKDTILQHGPPDSWQIPKLELLQSVVPGIHQSSTAMQNGLWISQNIYTSKKSRHQHMLATTKIINNSQIVQYLDRLNKCFCFTLAIYIEEHCTKDQAINEGFIEYDHNHKPDIKKLAFKAYHTVG